MAGTTGFAFDGTVNGLCERVTTLLNDAEPGYENERYDKGMVRALVCDALWLLSSFNPALFSAKRTIPLVPDIACQELPDDCSAINTFIAVIDNATGREVPATESAYEGVVRAGYYPICRKDVRRRGTGGTRGDPGVLASIPSFKIGRSRPDSPSFVITPVPPPGSDLSIIVECNTVDELFEAEDGGQLPGQIRAYFAPLMELVQYLLLSADLNSPGASAAATTHLAAFAQLSRTTVRAVQRVVDTAR